MIEFQPIDAVITWVNGSDENHRQKLAMYYNSLPEQNRPTLRATRFSDNNEILYCIESILHFAPWVRKIYIVADGQQPHFMPYLKDTNLENRIIMIDHTTIFRDHEDCLPTFNTRSIAAMLWRIPNLSEKFLFFNDDYLLASPVAPEDFFVDDKVVLRGKWKLSIFKNISNILKHKLFNPNKLVRPKHSTSQRVAATSTGFIFRYFMVPHAPHAFLKSTWQEFYDRHPEKILTQISYRLRSALQFNVDALSAHLNIKNKKALIKNDIKTTTIRCETMSPNKICNSLTTAFTSSNKSFLCVQSLDLTSLDSQKTIIQKLEKHLPPIIRTHLTP